MFARIAKRMSNFTEVNYMPKIEETPEKTEVKRNLEKLRELTRKLDDKEEQILDLKDMYEKLFNSLWNGVIILEKRNGGGYVLKDLNPSAERVEGINKSKIGCCIGNIFPDEPRFCEFYDMVKLAHSTGKKRHCALEKRDELTGKIIYHFDCYVYKIRTRDIVIVFEDITTKMRAIEEENKKKQLLKCSLEATEMLLNHRKIDIEKLLGSMCSATWTDRAYIFKNIDDNCAELYKEHTCVNDTIKNIDYCNLPTIKYYLESGHYICDTSTPPDSMDMDFCNRVGIQSFCIVPIYIDGNWWGLLGFEERKHKRNWTFDDINILKTIADVIGELIKRVGYDNL